MRDASQAAAIRSLVPPALIGACAAAVTLIPTTLGRVVGAAALLAPPVVWLVIRDAACWLRLFFLSAILLPPLPIALGNSGPHVAVLFAALGIPAGFLRLGEWRIKMGLLPASLVCFFAVLLGSTGMSLLSFGAAIGAGSLVRVLLFGVACYVFLFSAYGPDEDSSRLTRLLLLAAGAASLFACLDFYFQWPTPAGYAPQFIWLDSGVFRRAQGLFYEASTLGNFCACFLTLSALCLTRPETESPVSRANLSWIAPVLAAALLLSYSRASIVNLTISLSMLVCLQWRQFHIRNWAAPVVGIAGIAVLVLGLFREFAVAWFFRLWLSVEHFSSATDAVLSGRLASWLRLGQFLIDHPRHLLFGVGYKTLPYADLPGGPIIVDNMYLSLLAETGIGGLVAFLVLNAAILRTAWRARRSLHGAWILCFWSGQLVQMLSGDLFTYWRVLPVYFWVLGQAARHEWSGGERTLRRPIQ